MSTTTSGNAVFVTVVVLLFVLLLCFLAYKLWHWKYHQGETMMHHHHHEEETMEEQPEATMLTASTNPPKLELSALGAQGGYYGASPIDINAMDGGAAAEPFPHYHSFPTRSLHHHPALPHHHAHEHYAHKPSQPPYAEIGGAHEYVPAASEAMIGGVHHAADLAPQPHMPRYTMQHMQPYESVLYS